MTQNIYRYVLLYVSKCLPVNMCRGEVQGGDRDMYMCVWRGAGRGWEHVHVCVLGAREGMGTYTCVYGGDREGMGTYTCVCGGGAGRGWGNVQVCVEGDQGGDGGMYMCVWRGGGGREDIGTRILSGCTLFVTKYLKKFTSSWVHYVSNWCKRILIIQTTMLQLLAYHLYYPRD